MTSFSGVCFLFITIAIGSCKIREESEVAASASGHGQAREAVDPEPQLAWNQTLAADEMRLSILSTNDIHGDLEPSIADDNQLIGGMALWGGVVKAIKAGLLAREPNKVTIMTVDAGDQFQGTLPSNTNEGEAMMAVMNAIGYDAIVPGNHDYDFGPLEKGPGGWRVDRSPDVARRLEVIQNAARTSKAPFISANTFMLPSYRQQDASLQGIRGGTNCKATLQNDQDLPVVLDLKVALNKLTWPSYLKPFTIKTAVDGTKIAVIGLDNPDTPGTTTTENVVGLCFADQYDSYLLAYEQAKKAGAEIFILALHDGTATERDQKLLELIARIKNEEIRRQGVDGGSTSIRLLDAVISAHTHFSYAKFVGEQRVPLIQSGAGGKAFGRIDLIWNKASCSFVTSKTKIAGGIQLLAKTCDPLFTHGFCRQDAGKLLYEGQVIAVDADVLRIVEEARKSITQYEPNATKVLGMAHGRIATDGFKDAPLTQAMTDALRYGMDAWLQDAPPPWQGRKIDVAFMNASGLRAPFKSGPLTYENLFNTLPFSNYAVYMELDKAQLKGILERNIRNCDYGFLGQSGLQISYRRQCHSQAKTDPAAKLLAVKTLNGKVIVDANDAKSEDPGPFHIATLDFLADGGLDNVEFKAGRLRKSIDLARDVIANYYLQIAKADLRPIIDDRWSTK